MFIFALITAPTVGLFMVVPSGDAHGSGRVELSGDPHFRLILENTSVRVWMMELRPAEKTNLVARDHDFLQVPLDEGWMSTAIEGKPPVPFWVEKKPRFVRGGFAQIVQNTGKIVVRVIEVEFIQSMGAERCGPEAQVSCACWGAVGGIAIQIGCRVLETDDVAISQLEAHRGEKVGLPVVPVLTVPIDAIQIQPMSSSRDTALVLKPGKVLWVDKANQSIESLDQRATAKTVTVEFKSHAADPSSH
jgi:hypothetical protein